jgi:NADH dehydrogenase
LCAHTTSFVGSPGIAEHAYGFRSMAEAIYLRDAILRDIELAEATDDPAERGA